MKKIVYYLFILYIISLFFGCSGKSNPLDDITLSLETEKLRYYSGDTVVFITTVINPSSLELLYTWILDDVIVPGASERLFTYHPVTKSGEWHTIKIKIHHEKYGFREASLKFEVRPSALRTLYSSSEKALNRLDGFISGHSGSPPNMIKEFSVNGKKAVALYRCFEDLPGSIRNGGASNSETQVAFFNYLAIRAMAKDDFISPKSAYNYIRYFMMPHDGWESPELPDNSLLNVPSLEKLIHWLIQVDSVNSSGAPVTGDRIFPRPNTPYKLYDVGFENVNTSCIPLDGEGYPDVKLLWPGDENTYKFNAALQADQEILFGYILRLFMRINTYAEDIEKTKETLIACLFDSGPYPFTITFARSWGGNVTRGNHWIVNDPDIGSGDQLLGLWAMINEKMVAEKMLLFLIEAQKVYRDTYSVAGPFMPFYNSTMGRFYWGKASSNAQNMLYQFRTFQSLCMYYFISRDQRVREMVELFITFVEENSTVQGETVLLPFSLNSGIKDSSGIMHDRGNRGEMENALYDVANYALYLQGNVFLYSATGDEEYRNRAEMLAGILVANQQESGSFNLFGETLGYGHASAGIGLSLFNMMESKLLDEFHEFVITGLQDKLPQVLRPEEELPKELTTPSVNPLTGAVPLFGNRNFYLAMDQIVSYGNVTFNIDNVDQALNLTWSGKDWEGVLHEYNGSSWNGKPVDISGYKTLFLMLKEINGSSIDIKFSINDVILADFDQLKSGLNAIDLDKMRILYPGNFSLLKSINLTTRKGSTGTINIRMLIK